MNIETGNIKLFRPKQLDLILQWPYGKAARLARQGKIPHIVLPDGQIRFNLKTIKRMLGGDAGAEGGQNDQR